MPGMALFRRTALSPEIEVRGASYSVAGDWYHLMLRAPWWADLLVIVLGFLSINLLFAVAYSAVGGIAGARPGSFADLFFFSVQTMATIGYGSMYPQSTGAHLLTTGEALTGILAIAVCTGIIFSKFSVLRARVRFATNIVIAPMNGVPTLMIRVGHERSSRVIDAMIRVVLTRTERTTEGVVMYRMYDLKLERDHAPALSRAWMIFHTITPESPLFRASPETAITDELELVVSLSGIDETSGQMLHAGRTYDGEKELRWGHRFGDMVSPRQAGGFVLEMDKFDQLLPTEPTENFPYPQMS
jgi:inward rectifier potassium channel